MYVWARAALLWTFDSALLTVARIAVEAAVDDPDGSVQRHEGLPVPLPPRMGPDT